MFTMTRAEREALEVEVGEKAALSFDSDMAWVAKDWPVGPWWAMASSVGLLRVMP
jgi:hypothetical protein